MFRTVQPSAGLPVTTNLQGWLSTQRGSFLFDDATGVPANGKPLVEARDVLTGAVLFSQATALLRPTWDSATYDIPGVRSDGTQYLARGSALAAPGLVVAAVALDAGTTGNRAISGARSTGTPGGDALEDAWALRRNVSAAQLEAQVATSAAVGSAVTPELLGDKLLVMLEVVGNAVQVWQVGSAGEATLSGTRVASDGEQALLAKYYNDAIAAIFKGCLFEFVQYSPAPSRADRRTIVEFLQGLVWPTGTPPVAVTASAGEIPQGASGSADVVTPSTGSSLALGSIDEQPSVGSAGVSGNDVVVSVPGGAALGSYSLKYCLKSGVAGARLVDFGQVDFDVIAPSPGPTGLPEDQPLPTPLATKSANTGDFDAVVGGAQPGDRINLSSGSYGNKTISVSGTAANPIVVRSNTLLGAAFSGLTISGNWVIVSGVTVDAGSGNDTSMTVNINGNNCRVTRSKVLNGDSTFRFGAGMTDALVDHCDVSRSRVMMWRLADPENQNRITVARCWCHDMVGLSTNPQSHCFSWTGDAEARTKDQNIIVRLNYCGPGLGAGGVPSSDWIHQKGAHACYAFNRCESGAGGILAQRNGIRGRWVGNYASGTACVNYDALHWFFGNLFSDLKCSGGRSHYYDDTKQLLASSGGFHASRRIRMAGNSATVLLGWNGSTTTWCTTTSHSTLPDPQACGSVKGQRTFSGVTYTGDDPSHPDVGVKIRAHTGAVNEEPTTCIDWAQNISSLPSQAAPASWLNDLLAEYPWIDDVCPNPTSLTGGPGGSAPWSVAQALTRGDAATPNTGPDRASPGGLP